MQASACYTYTIINDLGIFVKLNFEIQCFALTLSLIWGKIKMNFT